MSYVTYEVRVSGLLPEDAAATFDDVRITTTDVSTVLATELADQAALLGLIARLRAMGLDVLEVRRVLGSADPPAQESGAPDGAPR